MAWLSDWTKRVPLTIDSSKIGSDLTHFPIPIFLNSSSGISAKDVTEIFDDLGANSKKIAITQDDGTTQIYGEIEQWDSVGEQAVLWVSKSDLVLDSDVDTILYLYFDNTQADNNSYIGDVGGRTEVFDSYTKAVWHLKELGNGTLGEYIDSTANNHDGQGGAGTGSKVPTQVDAKIYKGQSFDGGDLIKIVNHSDFQFGTSSFHIKVWVKFNDKTGVQNFIAYSTATGAVQFCWNGSNFTVYGQTSTVLTTSGLPTINNGQWYYLEFVRSGNNWQIYVDKISYASVTDTRSLGLPNHARAIALGAEVTAPSYSQFLKGVLDDFTVANGIARSNDWSNASYDAEIDNFVTFGNTEIDNEINIEETINLDDDWTVTLVEITDYGSQIIWLNPLIIVTNSDPAKISSIDITDPENPVKTTYELIGCKNAKGVVYNATNEYFYVICGEGKVVKVNKNDLEDQTIINTGETDIFTVVDALDTHLKTYAITDNSDGEIVMIDEREVKKINTDLRWLESIQYLISTRLDWINGKLINTDLRWIDTQISKLKTDLRWIAYEYHEIPLNMINSGNWVVKINGVDLAPLNDVDMDTVQIVHDVTAEEEKGSTVTFTLHRRFDKLDYTNAGTSSQITNQNAVIIEINGIQEFSGKITNLNCDDEGEIVTVTAIGSRSTDKRHTVSIPLTSVNEQLHPYHCILSKPNIDNPYIDTRFVITSDNNKYWNGSSWVAKKKNGASYSNYSSAQNYLEGVSKNKTTFWDSNPIVRNYEESPPYYKGIQVDLGTQIQQNIIRYIACVDNAVLAKQIEEGTFKPMQNWTYFWLVDATKIIPTVKDVIAPPSSKFVEPIDLPDFDIDFFNKSQYGAYLVDLGIMKYVGTSLGSMSADAWKIDGASYNYQKEQEDTEIELGVYQLGSAPYNVISVTNGKKITKQKWEDRNDGLYNVQDESYDYRKYVKRIAALEYQKIQNINGQVLPATSCQISLTLDAYYYYNLGLLTRVNISNTTIANTYNGNNGFPVAIKTITIRCATQGRNTMMVTLNCDNQKSQIEMEEIDAQYPDEDSDEFVFPATAVRVYQKFDPNSWSYPS